MTGTKSIYEKSLLIVLMGSIGDVTRALPIVSAIKQHHPKWRISWLVEPTCRELVAKHPLVDEVLVFMRGSPLSGFFKLILTLSKQQYDITLDLQRHFKSGLFSFLSRSPRRIGFHPRDSKEGNWIFQTEYLPHLGEELSKIEHYQKFLEKLDVPIPEKLDFGIHELGVEEVLLRFQIPKTPLVSIILGSSWSSKDWFEEEYLKLVEDIIKNTIFHVTFIGDSRQKELAARLASKIGSPRLHNLVGLTSLIEAAALLKASRLGVGPDSGPGHIAAAVGTPYISLFGPTSPARTAPYNNSHLVIQSPIGCAPCYRRDCPGLGRLCMRLVRAESVIEKMRPLLSS